MTSWPSDGACAPVTDGAGFANRQISLDADAEVNEYYGRQGIPLRAARQTVTFDRM